MTEINKYQNGKIYKIVCNKTNLVYIGSTIQKYLSNRLKGHLYDFKTQRKNSTSFKVLESNDYYIELVELYSCNSKDELLVRERYYFDIFECVNKLKPKITIEEKKEQHFKACKKYRENNRDNINEKYKENNKKYYYLNKDIINKKRKELYKLKKEQLIIDVNHQ
jgi:hypothetical protein